MTTADRISRQVAQLPESFQKEVMDFIEFLAKKAKEEHLRKEDLEWFSLSITPWVKELKDEKGPDYSLSDLKEKWK